MSIRTVSYLLNGENDLPESPQYGGVRYENNATSVAFTLDENYKFNIENAYPNTQLVYRIDFNSRNAGYNPSENLVLTDNAVSRTIPLCMTFYGEQITATLVITAIDDDGNAVGTILSPEIKIYFDDVTKDEPTSSVIGENISAIEKRTEEFCVLAEKQAELAEGFADIAADNATFSQAAADNAADSAAIAKSAEQNTETVVENHKADASAHSFLFDNKVDKADGMGLSSNDYTLAEKEKLTSIENGAQVNIAPDQTYSPTSENAQSGKAVAQALSGRTPIEIADGSLAINFTDNGIYEIIGVEIYGTNYEVYTEYGSVYVPNSTPPAQLVVGAKFYIELGESINNYTRNINKLELVGNPYVKEDNIKTINGNSLVGSGDIAISGGAITGDGEPTDTTKGDIGQLYMNTDTNILYKCVEVKDGTYTWELVVGGGHYEIGKNKFNVDTITEGKFLWAAYNTTGSSPVLSDNAEFGLSDWIEVDEGKSYVFNSNDMSSAQQLVFVFADEDGILVADGFGAVVNTPFVIPAGCVKCRFSAKLIFLQNGTAQLEKGTVRTPYEPYTTTYINNIDFTGVENYEPLVEMIDEKIDAYAPAMASEAKAGVARIWTTDNGDGTVDLHIDTTGEV